ncbi:hypothetical protein RZS08_10185, partial [Arthrospira platensis SPKY1]|nr:hypothetical protein [Arthrospira platensis SPKY1]
MLVTMLVLGLLFAFLVFSYRSTAAATATGSHNEARVLATKLDGVLRRVEMSATFAHDNFIELGLHEDLGSERWQIASGHLRHYLRQIAGQFPEALAILVTDTEGRIVSGSFEDPPD